MTPLIVFGLLALVIGGILLFFANRYNRRLAVVSQAHPIAINQVRAGQPAAVQGLVKLDQPLTTPISHQSCVYYEYRMEQLKITYDAKGQEKHHWVMVAHDRKSTPFWLQDESGRISIDPSGASFMAKPLSRRKLGVGDVINDPGLAKIFAAVASPNIRVQEKVLLVNSPAYVYGQADAGQQGLVMHQGAGEFIISYQSEKELQASIRRMMLITGLSGGVLAMTGLIMTLYKLFVRK